MSNRQYAACEFKPGSRAYTYHWDGDPLAPGDRVMVEARSGGNQAVSVVSASDQPPPFATKPILGLAEMPPEPAPAADDTPLGAYRETF